MEVILELKTEVAGAWDQWRLDMQPVQMALVILHLASQRHLTKILQSMHHAEDHLHHFGSLGIKVEASGAIGEGKVVQQEGEDRG